MLVSLVTSTIGRPAELRQLLASLSEIESPQLVELVLVDQSPDAGSIELVRNAGLPFPVRTARSATGLSHGRNVGLTLARGEVVAFPDDDCFYAPATIRTAAELMRDADLAGISGVLRTHRGDLAMLRWPGSARDVTARNFYRTALSSTLFLRRSVVAEVGGFDETLGAGSTQGYLSGEESDLVLKMLAAGHRIRYDPSFAVFVEEQQEVPTAYDKKMEGYGRGFGRLFKQHGLGQGRFQVLLARKDAGACLRRLGGKSDQARSDRAFTRAAREGYRTWR